MLKKTKIKIATLLVIALTTIACTVPPWVTTVENDAAIGAEIALSLVTVIDPPLIPLVTLIDNALNALRAATKTFKGQPTATNLQTVQALTASLQANLKQLEAAAQIKNAGSQDKISAIVTILSAAITEIASQVPASSSAATLNIPASGPKPHGGDYFKQQFNNEIQGDPRFQPIK